jgi:hypothetical protein
LTAIPSAVPSPASIQALFLGLSIVGCAHTPRPTDGSTAPGAYVIGPNVRVSVTHSSAEIFETQIAANPRRAGHLIACAIARTGDTTRNVFYVSSDGGRTWTHTLTIPTSVDPSCAIDADGVAYAASVHDSMPSTDSYLNVQRSSDGGQTWKESAVRVDTRSMDRSYVTVGDAPESRRDRVYVHAYRQTPKDENGRALVPHLVLYTSADSGRTFDRAVSVKTADFAAPWFFPANGTTLGNGVFLALAVSLDNTQRNMFRGRSDSGSAPHSVNGVLQLLTMREGEETPKLSRVSDAYYDWRVPQLSMSSLAVDRSHGPFRGRVYVVWPDARFGRRTQILFTTSNDTGRTWSAPRVVSDDSAFVTADRRPNNFMPMVAVNAQGVVGISWYDRRDSPNNLTYSPRFAASLDGGTTFLPSTGVSTSPNTLGANDRHLNGGDTSGLAPDAAGVFHLLWIDNRTGIGQAWTATVAVSANVRPR